MKVVYMFSANGKMEIRDYFAKVKGKIIKDNKWIVKSIINNLYKIPEHIRISGDIIFATTLEFDYIKEYKILEVDLLVEDKSITFHIKNLHEIPKEARDRTFKYIVKILANLFNKQPVSVNDKEIETLEKIYKKKFKRVTVILVDDKYLLPKKYMKKESNTTATE